MIHLLFVLVMAEMGLILTLLFRNPLRTVVIMGLDRSKKGRGPLVAKSVGGTILVVFISTIYSIMKIQKRSKDAGLVNPTDEVLMAHRHLEVFLIGFFLFLALIIDRLHYYIRELNLLRKKLEMTKKSNQDSDYLESRGVDKTEKPQIKQLEFESTQSQKKQKLQLQPPGPAQRT